MAAHLMDDPWACWPQKRSRADGPPCMARSALTHTAPHATVTGNPVWLQCCIACAVCGEEAPCRCKLGRSLRCRQKGGRAAKAAPPRPLPASPDGLMRLRHDPHELPLRPTTNQPVMHLSTVCTLTMMPPLPLPPRRAHSPRAASTPVLQGIAPRPFATVSCCSMRLHAPAAYTHAASMRCSR